VGGSPGGVEAADDTDDDSEAEADDDILPFEDGSVFGRGDGDKDAHNPKAGDETEHAADEADDRAFDDDLDEDVSRLGTDCAANTDLPNALGDAREHDVGDPDATNDQANAGNEAVTLADRAHAFFGAIEPLFPGVESEVLNAAMGDAQDIGEAIECLFEARGIRDLDD
jgi:hypothetical protein